MPLVALAAASPIGRALFHMIPASLAPSSSDERVSLFLVFGLALFMGLEQFAHWHHCHRAEAGCR